MRILKILLEIPKIIIEITKIIVKFLIEVSIPLIFLALTLCFISLNILVIYLVFFKLFPWIIFKFPPLNEPFKSLLTDFVKNTEFDFGQFLVFVGALCTANFAWLRYLGSKDKEQFATLSERSSSTEENIVVNAVSTLPIFSSRRTETIFERYLVLKNIKDSFCLLKDFCLWTFHGNSFQSHFPTEIQENIKKFLLDYFPTVSKCFNLKQWWSENDSDLIRRRYIECYDRERPYVRESINILINLLVIESQKPRDENAPYTFIEKAVSEALTKINTNTLKKVVINNKSVEISAVDLSYKNLENLKFYKTDLSGAYLKGTDLSKADLHEAGLISSNLRNANLFGTKLCNADLNNAILSNADLSNAYLNSAYLNGADLSKAVLKETDLSNVKLNKANLSEADLKWADLRRTNLSEAKLRKADLSEAIIDINSWESCKIIFEEQYDFLPIEDIEDYEKKEYLYARHSYLKNDENIGILIKTHKILFNSNL